MSLQDGAGGDWRELGTFTLEEAVRLHGELGNVLLDEFRRYMEGMARAGRSG